MAGQAPVVPVGVSGAAYGELMATVVPRRRGWRRREVGVPGAVASAEAGRARAQVRDGLRHVRTAALRASWRRAVIGAVTLALAVGVGAAVLGAGVAAAVELALVAATVAMARWWRRLPPRTAPPDATARGWQAIVDGERRSARPLRQMARQGWFVVHDPLALDGRSLGQVVVGPTGIAALQSCVCQGPLRVSASGVWMGGCSVDLSACVAAAQVVCDVVAEELHRPGVRAMPVLVVHGAPMARDGYHVAGVDVVPAAHLVSYLQRLRLARLDAETVDAAGRAVVARLDVAGVPAELGGTGRYCRRST
jgi:hypothetical protein